MIPRSTGRGPVSYFVVIRADCVRAVVYIEKLNHRIDVGDKNKADGQQLEGGVPNVFSVQRSVRGVTILCRWDGQNPLPTRQNHMTDDFVYLFFFR